MTSATLVIIPTYNERENIASIVSRVRAATPEVDILVVDDNSPDGTGAIADELAAADNAISVLHRVGKEGLGAAYKHGFRWGLERGYDRLVEMDADGSHAPEQLPALLEASEHSDVVQGSRWVQGGSVVNWPLHRQLISKVGSMYARLMLGVPVKDVTGGYRVFSAHALETIRLETVHSMGYGFQVDMLFRAHQEGLRITEVPITFAEREYGESKISMGIVVEAMLRVTGWGIRNLPARLRGQGRPAETATANSRG
ncbi:polyprenol monophosphomannose synthase [Lysinibacter cavernae]|uniref:Dolichol-phosphate mannosyltransferase n=1 Tax=Lysinibacter cavernae TaxID=1640652 RepID=A0A7X5R3X0_9MICO|nr:polyprenol monophosphomannose synthase [Lysinibacter cavernae]NIH55203.1 dolichol-phosphate mannosyltransferase [Lysinibacter cavernae]